MLSVGEPSNAKYNMYDVLTRWKLLKGKFFEEKFYFLNTRLTWCTCDTGVRVKKIM